MSNVPTPAVLDELARQSREGNSHARNLLWEHMQEVVRRAVDRQRGLPRLWEREDLHQEAFLVFAAVCDAWPGQDFARYCESEYPAELARHVRRVWRKQARERSLPLALELSYDPAPEREYRLTELLEPLSRLPASMELALRLHLLWGLPLSQVGSQLGLGRRALGGLLPLARRAAEGEIENPQERLERLTRGLYAFADSSGRLRATAREVRARLNLSPREHADLITTLQERGILTGRRKGNAGRLPPGGPEAAVVLLRQARGRRIA